MVLNDPGNRITFDQQLAPEVGNARECRVIISKPIVQGQGVALRNVIEGHPAVGQVHNG